MPLLSRNPSTEEIIKEFKELTNQEIDEKLSLAFDTFHSWRETSFDQRAQKMRNAASLLRERNRTYATIVTQEMGKPMRESLAMMEKCAWVCEYYADNAEEFLKPEMVETDGSESYVRFDPIGIVLAVMPWNFPFWQVFRFIAPAAMAGNVGVLKHASNVQMSADAIEEIFRDAGFPVGVFQNFHIGSGKVEQIINDPRVRAATLTGSEYAGSQVAMQAGKQIKKTVLELGGSDPFIVLEDADLDQACVMGAGSRLLNTGQSCIAAKRFIVVDTIFDEFIIKFKEAFEKKVIGDPMDEKTEVGPLVNQQALNDISGQVEKSVAQGATVVTGGKQVGDKGYFYAPTILTDLKPGMPAYNQEIFGPVASVFRVKDADEAVTLANSIDFGLGSAIFTRDIEKAKELARRIESGAVFINSFVKSDPRMPFGGVKRSGYGRELSHYGIKEFVNIKSVWVK